jgi:hypothetical protein
MKKRIRTLAFWAAAIIAVGAIIGCQSDVTESTPPGNPIMDEDMPYWSVWGYVLDGEGKGVEGLDVLVWCDDCCEIVREAAEPTSESGFYLVWIGMSKWTEHSGHTCMSIAEGCCSEPYKLEGGGPTHYLGPKNIYW